MNDEKNPSPGGGAPDKSIGRPSDWSEKRYERTSDEGKQSVIRKPGEQVTPDAPASTPVTQKDYHHPQPRK